MSSEDLLFELPTKIRKINNFIWIRRLFVLSYLSLTCDDEFIRVRVFSRLTNLVLLKSCGTKPSTAEVRSPGMFWLRKSHPLSLPYTRQVSICLPVHPKDGLQQFPTVDSHWLYAFGWTAIYLAKLGFQTSLPGSDVSSKPGCQFWDLNCQFYRINTKITPLRSVTSSHLTQYPTVTF